MHKVLTDIGFVRSENDVCLYSKQESDGWCRLLVYVDDMTLTAKSLDTIERMKSKIASKFEIQDLGDMKYYLEVTRDDGGIFHLCQSNYIRKMINNFGMTDSKISNVPMDPGDVKGRKDNDEGLLLTNTKYRQLVGSLLYVSVCTDTA